MLVAISYPVAVANEAAIITELFDEGLETLHIRKPCVSACELGELIEKISSKYHHRIALHQHHDIATSYGIKRLHFPEAKRNELRQDSLVQLKLTNHILSTSIHAVEAYKNIPASFDYIFFGPVFNSISKKGYTSAVSDDFMFPVQPYQPKVIAIGGIEAANIQKVKQMQFNGAAVLGIIWKKPGESIEQFKKVQKSWNQTGQ